MTFKELASKERRAILLERINNKVEGCLTKEQLETVVNKVDVDIDVDYEITVVKTAKELSSIAMLKEHKEEEYGKETKEVGEIIFGDLVFGKDYYSSNSQYTYTYQEEPFEMDPMVKFILESFEIK